MVWAAVRQRFAVFAKDLHLTEDQWSDGQTKLLNVGRSLERTYYGGNRESGPPAFMVGSWGKRTQVRPPADLDAFFVLPQNVKQRFDLRTGNVQSALLQEVKDALLDTFPQTTIRGDGQVVSVGFNSLTVEVVPVFERPFGQYWMPDTNEGGRWKAADPVAQFNMIENADKLMNGNVRSLAKMIKLWKREQNVPLKSFVVEMLVAEFLPARGNGWYDTYWFDFYVRDFFTFLVARANTFITIPGTAEVYFLGDAWLGKAQTAQNAALSACALEYMDLDEPAGREWQKVFGNRIPMKVL